MATDWSGFKPIDSAPSANPAGNASGGADWSQFTPADGTPSPLLKMPDSGGAAPDDTGDFMRGFKRTLPELKQLAGGSIAAVGDVTGWDGARDYGLDLYKRGSEKVSTLTHPTDSFTEARKQGVGGLVDFAQNAAGYTAGQALESLTAAAAGAALGSEVPVAGNIAGAVGGLVAKGAIKRAALKYGEGLLAEQLEKGVAKEVAGEAAKKATLDYLATATAKKSVRRAGGAAIGAGAFNELMELGSIYPEAMERAHAEGRELTGIEQIKAVGSSLAAAGVESAADIFNLGVLFRGTKNLVGAAAKTGLKQAAKDYAGRASVAGAEGALREGGTEAVQSGIERFGAGQSLTDADAWRDYIDSAAVGAVGGVLFGGVAAVHAQPKEFGKDPGDDLRADVLQAKTPEAFNAAHTKLIDFLSAQHRVGEAPAASSEASPQLSAPPAAVEAALPGSLTEVAAPPPPPPPAPRAASDNMSGWKAELEQSRLRYPAAAPGSLSDVANTVPDLGAVAGSIADAANATPPAAADPASEPERPASPPSNLDPETGELLSVDAEAWPNAAAHQQPQAIIAALAAEGMANKKRPPSVSRVSATYNVDAATARALRTRAVQEMTRASLPPVSEDVASDVVPASTSDATAPPVADEEQPAPAAAVSEQAAPAAVEDGEEAGASASPPVEIRGQDTPAANEQPVYDESEELLDGDIDGPSGGPFTIEDAAQRVAANTDGSSVRSQPDSQASQLGSDAGQGTIPSPTAPSLGDTSQSEQPQKSPAPAPRAGEQAPAQPSPLEGTAAADQSEGPQRTTEPAPQAPAERTSPGSPASKGRSTSVAVEEKASSSAQATLAAGAVQPKTRVKQGKRSYVESAPETLQAYFQPGRIVDGYGGHDRVVAFTPPKDGNPWSVRVIAVDENGQPKANERERQHATLPSQRELVKVLGKAEKPVPKRKAKPKTAAADTSAAELHAAAHEAATSHQNDLRQPTEAQKEAGNYAKGHARIAGLDISIENPRGSRRNEKWKPLAHHYGYIKGTVGNDKDHVDVFLTDHAADPARPVFVVDQVNKDGSFDEHKVVMGATDEAEARKAYLDNYTVGWSGLGSITQMSLDEFKAWVKDSEQTRRPAFRRNRTEDTRTGRSAMTRGVPAGPEFRKAVKVGIDAAAKAGKSPAAIARSLGEKERQYVHRTYPDKSVVASVESWLANNPAEATPDSAENTARSPSKPAEDATPAAEDTSKGSNDAAKPSENATGDVGEELIANRRNLLGKGLQWSDIKDLNAALKIKEATKSKVWPRPDYQALIAAGMLPPTAHVIKQVYDGIATAPQVGRGAPTDEQLQEYIETVGKIREAVFEWAKKGEYPSDAIIDAAFPMPPGSRSRWRDSDGTVNQNNARALLVGGNRVHRAVSIDIRSHMGAAEKAVKAGWPGQQEAWQRLYQITSGANGWRVVRARRYIATGLGSRQEAEALAKEHYETNKKQPQQESETGLSVEDAKREGRSWRAPDEDISSARLQEKFGFKGVNFGNWMKGESPAKRRERQLHLNATFDSMMDLANLIGVPPKAISLNGTLGIAFGAQGSGGRAMAHFVPGVNEINITRANGAGSLAHEWAHALDHYFAVQAGEESARSADPFLTNLTLKQRIEDGVRPEVAQAFQKILNVMHSRPLTEAELTSREKAATAHRQKNIARPLAALRALVPKENTAALTDFDELAERLSRGDVGEGRVETGRRVKPVGVHFKVAETVSQTSAQMLALLRENGVQDDAALQNLTEADSQAASLAMLAQQAEQRAEHAPQTHRSDFLAEAGKLESASGKAYWTTPWELFARAFQSYVIDRLADSQARNDYLSRPQMDDATIKVAKDMGLVKADRFPRGDERNRINTAFDTLIGELRTEENADGNVRLFSQGEGASGLDFDRALQLKRELTAKWGKNAPTVILVQDAEGFPADAKVDPAYRRGEGFYNGKPTVWINVGAIGTEQRFGQVLAHEALGHYGVERVVGAEQWNGIVATIARHDRAGTGNAAIKAAIADVHRRYGALDRTAFAKEVIAVLAEQGARSGLLDRVVSAVRRYLRKIMPSLSWSGADVVGLLGEADSFLRAGTSNEVSRAAVAAMSFSRAVRSAYADAGKFAQAVKALRAGQFASSEPIQVTEGTPDVYRKLGARDLPITISRGKIDTILREHPEMNEAILQQLVRHLHEPVAVFDSKSQQGALVALTSAMSNGKPVVAALHLNVRDGRTLVNRVASVYGKESEEKIRRWIQEGRLRYLDQTKIPTWLTTRGLQLPKVGPDQAGTSGRRVLSEADVVKPFTSGVGAYSQPRAQLRVDAAGQRSVELGGETFVDRGGQFFMVNGTGHPKDFKTLAAAQEAARLTGGEVLADTPIEGERPTWSVVASGTVIRGAELPNGRLPLQGLFSMPPAEILDDIDAVMRSGVDSGWLERSRESLRNLVPKKVKDQLRPAWLGALATRHLTELGADYFDNIKHYSDFLAEQGADRNRLQAEAEGIAEPARKWAGRNRPAAEAMFDLMHEATIEGVDPSEGYQPLQFRYGGQFHEVTPKKIKEALAAIREQMRGRSGDNKTDMLAEAKTLRGMPARERRRRQKYAPLVERWNRLPPQAQEIYRQFRDLYEDRSKQVEEGLVARINDTDVPENHKRKLINTIRQQFETQRLQGVYFPLQRFGRYFVAATKGDTPTFLMFENLNQMDRAVKDLRGRGFTITAQGLKGAGKAKDAPSGTFVAEVIQTMHKAGVSEKTQDEIYQIYLESLPELSMRKHAIHRQAVPGFDPDAIRAFAFNMHHGAHQLARLRYSHKLQNVLDVLRQQQDAARKEPGADTRKIVAGDAIIDELGRRHEWINNPQDSQLTNLVTSAGFTYYLGLTPAAALVNLTQTAMVTYPYLASRFGAVKAMNHLLAGMRDAIRTRGNIQKTLTDPEEQRAHNVLQAMGALDKTQAHNLAGIAEGGLKGYNPAWSKAMEIIGWGFHKTEVVNREASGMAAFRLARAEGQSFDQAVKFAAEAINDTHFDYTNANRARFMQSGTAKVLLMFRQYSLNMTWHLGRMVWQASKGQTPEVRRIARRNLAGILGTSALFSGVFGLPMMGMTMGVLNAIASSFGDDDEPWDAKTEFRAFLSDMLGDTAAQVLLEGPTNAATGADIASRVGLSDMWIKDADRELDGRGAYYNLLEQAAGPMGGVLKNALIGKQLMDDGHLMRGVETVLPKALKDMLKAGRYATQGVNNLRGDPLVADPSLYQTLLQLGGFTPAKVAEQYDTNRSLKNYEQHILDRRQYLMDAYAMSSRLGDGDALASTLESIRAFNAANPEIGISPKNIKASLRSRARYSAKAESGIVLNPKIEAKVRAQVGVE